MKKIKKTLLLLSCLALTIVALGSGIKSLMDVKAYDTEFTSQVNVATRYIVGDNVTIPRAFLNVNGESKLAQKAVVKYPNGYYYEQKFDGSSANFIAEMAGGYEVIYKANYGGITYTATKEFFVEEELFVFNLNGSSATYFAASEYYGSPEGLSVSLQPNDSFTYNKKIDLTQLGRMDAIVDLFPTPEVKGTRDYREMVITLTDIYDSNNFVKIYFDNPVRNDGQEWEMMNCYSRAGASGQAIMGIEGGMNLHKNTQYGKAIEMSFDGYHWEVGEKSFPLYMDLAEKKLYCDASNYHIIDLDEPSYQSYLWEGFTTGEVYLSLSINDSSGGKFFVKTIGFEDLSRASYIDEKGADITILTEYDQLPQGQVNVGYSVPEASTASSYGKVEISTKVFYNYGLENQVQFNIVNGKFTPVKLGMYTIVYEATDMWGIKKQVLYSVEIVEEIDPIIIRIDQDGKVNEAYAGYELEIATATAFGGTGNLTLSVSAVNMKDGSTYEVKDGKFRPMSTGVYKIVYSCADYISVQTSSYLVDITADAKPVIIDDVYIPDFILKGTNIKLPALHAYDFTSGKGVAKEMEIWAIEGDTERKLEGGVLNTVTAASEIGIEYRLGGATKKYTRDLVSVGFEDGALDLAKYFVGDSVVTVDKNNATITTDKDTTVRFVNYVADGYLSLEYSFDTMLFNFGKLNVWFTDAKDSNIQIKVSYVKNGNGVQIVVNDKDVVSNIPVDDLSSRLRLSYDQESRAISPIENKSLYIYNTANGDSFTGFTSGLVYLSFEFENVTDESAFKVWQINNQTIRSTKYDIGFPQVDSSNTYLGRWNIGTIIDINPVVMADVLDTNVTGGLTVRTPKGEYAIALDGTVLKNVDPTKTYQIQLNEYGVYVGTYQAMDTAQNETTVPFTINVPDVVPPVLAVNSETNVKVNVGDIFSLPTATVTDNISENLKVNILVMTPNHRTMLLEENTTHIVAAYAGLYTITYTVYDDAGNLAIQTIYLTVV